MVAEWLILADWAEVIGNKLYLMGGGWDYLQHSGMFPYTQQVGMAASFLVPWDETNQRHAFIIEILTDNGEPQGPSLQGHLEAGRPVGVRAGSTQRLQLATNISLRLERPGGYVVQLKVSESVLLRTPFTVIKI